MSYGQHLVQLGHVFNYAPLPISFLYDPSLHLSQALVPFNYCQLNPITCNTVNSYISSCLSLIPRSHFHFRIKALGKFFLQHAADNR